MQHVRNAVFACASLLAAPLFAAAPANPAFDAELLSIQQAWAKVNYETPAGDDRATRHSTRWKRGPRTSRTRTPRAPRR